MPDLNAASGECHEADVEPGDRCGAGHRRRGRRLRAQQPAAPTLVLTNGKIITVDERFTIAQAVADPRRPHRRGRHQPGDRRGWPGPARAGSTCAAGRSFPGSSTTTCTCCAPAPPGSAKCGGTASSRGSARSRCCAPRAKTRGAGRVGLQPRRLGDRAVRRRQRSRSRARSWTGSSPNHPVLLQASYYEAYLNSRALQVLGIDEKTPERLGRARRRRTADGPDRRGGLPRARRQAADAAAGRRSKPARVGDDQGPEPVGAHRVRQRRLRSRRAADLPAVGGPGSAERPRVLHHRRRRRHDAGAGRAARCRRSPQMKLFQGDNYIDHIFYGESVYGPLHDPMFLPQVGSDARAARAVAPHRRPRSPRRACRCTCTPTSTNTIDAFLDQIEAVNKEYPIRNLRWVLAHVNQLNAVAPRAHEEAGHVRGRASVGGHQRRHQPARSSATRPTTWRRSRTIQNSGIMWGFGSDGSRANQILPFTTLWWAVTGKMVGGTKVLRQTISREDALIAHTRKNAYLVFQENNLGSIQPGKLADLRRARSRLPDGPGRSDQGHQAGDDDGRRQGRVRRQQRDIDEIDRKLSRDAKCMRMRNACVEERLHEIRACACPAGRRDGVERLAQGEQQEKGFLGGPLVIEDQGSFFIGGVQKVTSHAAAPPPPAPGTTAAPGRRRRSRSRSARCTCSSRYRRRGNRACRRSSWCTAPRIRRRVWSRRPTGAKAGLRISCVKGISTYIVDQAGRGRSGFDESVIHEAAAMIRYGDVTNGTAR